MRRNDTPLTDEQRELAARYWPAAEGIARDWSAGHPGLAAEFRSAAGLALVQAARSYDPARGVKFGTYCRHRIEGEMREVLCELNRSHYPGGASLLLFPDVERGGHVVRIPSREGPVGRELEEAEAFEARIRPLPARHAAICRAVYARGLNQSEAAAEMGGTKSWACMLVKESAAMLRGDRGPRRVPGRPPLYPPGAILALDDRGTPVKAIAARLGCDEKTVRRVLRLAGRSHRSRKRRAAA